MKASIKTFSMLSRGLYEPLIEKTRERLLSNTREITEKYALRGFSIPPGAMYAEIGECYKASIPMRAEIIFDCCCQAHKASTPKPGTEEFSKELLDAISREQDRILATGQAHFNQFDAQFKIPRYKTLLERYKSEILSEGRRFLRYYAAKAIAFLGESTAEVVPSLSARYPHWYQRPIGIIGLAVTGGVLVILVAYLIKQHFGLAL